MPSWKACVDSSKYLAPLLGELLALPTNIRLGWKGLPATDALAYSVYV